MGLYSVAECDLHHIIDSEFSLCLDDYSPPDGNSINRESPSTVAVVSISKIDANTRFNNASNESLEHLRTTLRATIQNREAYILQLHFSVSVLMYLNNALVTSLASMQPLAEINAIPADPQLSTEAEEYLPGTLTAWNTAIAERMKNFTSGMKDAFNITLATDDLGEETLLIEEDSAKRAAKAEFSEAVIESPVCAYRDSEDAVNAQFSGSEPRTQLLTFLLPPSKLTSKSGSLSTRIETVPGETLETKHRSKKTRLKNICLRCFRCSRLDPQSTEENLMNIVRRQHSYISLEYDATASGALKSITRPSVEIGLQDPIESAHQLLQVLQICVEELLQADSSPTLIIDITMNTPPSQLSQDDQAEVGAVIRRGTSWTGEVTDSIARKLIAVTRNQMNLWLCGVLGMDHDILWSHRNLLQQLRDRRAWSTVTITPRVLRRGDHLYRRIRQSGALGFVTHHGLYVGDGNVIHYSGNENAITTLLVPDLKATRLTKCSIYKFVSGHTELIVRQYVRQKCPHGSWLACAAGCDKHKTIGWPENTGAMTEEDCNALIFRRRHILSEESNSQEPWFTVADLADNAVKRAEYAYAMFHREVGNDDLDLVVPDEKDESHDIVIQKSTYAEDHTFPVIYSFPAYNLFRSNCEHFVTWCVTSWGFSLQVSFVTTTLYGAMRGFHS